jgi:hypothetical protein
MPNSGNAAIVAANPLLTGGTSSNLYTALTWVTNPSTSTLDLIYADAEQHKIWRLPGPLYKSPVVIYSWSKGAGPAYPVGLAADPSGNVYVISPSSSWGKPGVWVLPIIATGAKAGTYGAPLLIDGTFDDPVTHKPVSTLALTEVAVASSAASGSSPAWSALDLLVLVADPSNTRVIRYSQAQIQGVLTAQPPFKGPASNVVTQAQFQTQTNNKIPAIPVGMDLGLDPTTQDSTLLFATVDGRILDFDSAKNAFITPYAVNLGLGLTRVKVGTFQGVQYVFAGQLPGQILEFASPPAGTSNKTPFAKVSKGVSNPSDLAVTHSGTTTVGGPSGKCISAPCSILPQLSLQFTGPGTGNIPANSVIVADSCSIAADPRVTFVEGAAVYNPVTLNLGTLCANMPNVLLSANIFGGSGPTGSAIYAAKITSGLNQYNSTTMTTPINNTLTQFILNPGAVLGTNPPCGSPNGPVVAWGPIPEVESNIPEGTLVDITVACTSDPPPAGSGSHPSVITEGTVVAGTGFNATYIDGEFGNLQTAFNNIQAPQVQPPGTQIVDSTGTVVPAIQNYITQSLNYFNQGVAAVAAGGSAAGTPYFNCALNTLATGARYINSTVPPGDFVAGPPPYDDENPRGTLLWRLDHLYYDVNIYADNPPITTDALNPATSVPACTPPAPASSQLTVSNPYVFELAQTQSAIANSDDFFISLTITPASESCYLWDSPAVDSGGPPPNALTVTGTPSSQTYGYAYGYGTFENLGDSYPVLETWTLSCPSLPQNTATYYVYSPGQLLTFEVSGDFATGSYAGDPINLSWTFQNLAVNDSCTVSSNDPNFPYPSGQSTSVIGGTGGASSGAVGGPDPLITGNGNFSFATNTSDEGNWTATLNCYGITATVPYTVLAPAIL